MKQIENLRSFVAFVAFVLIACTLLIWRPGWAQQAGTEVYASPYMIAAILATARKPFRTSGNAAWPE